MKKNLLSLSDVNYHIGKRKILRNLNFNLREKEIVTVVGPNGAGKTTLLSIALGLINPSSGQVRRYLIANQDIRIGYVPQQLNRDLTMPVSVLEFMQLSKNHPSKSAIKKLFAKLNLNDLLTAFLSDLSGGELRWVLFARALLNNPHLLVLDEPTAGVDISGQKYFYYQLNEFRHRYHFAILMVSHDLHLVMSATDRVICLNGHICCQGKPEQVINNPLYKSLFSIGSNDSQENLGQLAFYHHKHDHSHR